MARKKTTKTKVILTGQEQENANKMIEMFNAKQCRKLFRDGLYTYEDLTFDQIVGIYDALAAGYLTYKYIGEKLGWPLALRDQDYETLLCENPIWSSLRQQDERGTRRREMIINGQKIMISSGVQLSDDNLRSLIKLNIFEFLQSPHASLRDVGLKRGMTYLEKFGTTSEKMEKWSMPQLPGLLDKKEEKDDYEERVDPEIYEEKYDPEKHGWPVEES